MFIDTSTGDVRVTIGFGEFNEVEIDLKAVTAKGMEKLEELKRFLEGGVQPPRFSWLTPRRQIESAPGEFRFALV